MLKSTEKKRAYCSLCSNYRGKIVNSKPVALHKFPADSQLYRVWTQRVKTVMPKFLHSKHSRVCSSHFVNGEMSSDNNVPSVFDLSSGRKKVFEITSTRRSTCLKPARLPVPVQTQEQCMGEDILQEEVDMEVEDCPTQHVDSENYCGLNDTSLQTSVMLHDYCGAIDRETLSTSVNKSEQTDPIGCLHVHVPTQKVRTYTDASVQCSIDVKSTLVQTETSCFIRPVQTSSVGIQTSRPDVAFEDIKDSDEKVMFYTGLPNAGTFHVLFDEMSDAFPNTQRKEGVGSSTGRPRALRLVEEFFLVLMRLRLGLLLEDLAGRFHISKSTCGCIVSKWIDYLHIKLAFMTPWPSRTIIHKTMPRKFQKKYPRCRVIIDCTEIFTETPQSLCNKTLMYSHYKTHMTYKALLGISPSGIITFASDLWGGSISDKQITRNSGLLDMCERGDAIMADKGFVISDLTTPKGIHLIVPPFKHKRFSRREIEETRRIANLRIDVERAMERVKNFRILQGTMPITLSSQATKIWKTCVNLANLQPPLIHDESD